MAVVEIGSTGLFNDANFIAYWKLESTADSKGAFTLTNNGTASFTAAKFNNGWNGGTDNTTKWMSIANNLGIDGNANSVSMWVKWEDVDDPTSQIIYEQNNNNTSVAFTIAMNNTGGAGNFNIQRRKPGVANEGGNYRLPFVNGTWYHLVMTYNATTVKGYIDGVERISFAASGTGTIED